jgi:hypothetical protein
MYRGAVSLNQEPLDEGPQQRILDTPSRAEPSWRWENGSAGARIDVRVVHASNVNVLVRSHFPK